MCCSAPERQSRGDASSAISRRAREFRTPRTTASSAPRPSSSSTTSRRPWPAHPPAAGPGGVAARDAARDRQISREDMRDWGDWWRFTAMSARAAVRRRVRRGAPSRSRQHGNVHAAGGFLYGLAAEDLTECVGVHGSRFSPGDARVRAVRASADAPFTTRCHLTSGLRSDVAIAVRVGRTARVAPRSAGVSTPCEPRGSRPLVFPVRTATGSRRSRNDALAATPADVLAFVEDDIAVGDRDGSTALQEAWAARSGGPGLYRRPDRGAVRRAASRWLTRPAARRARRRGRRRQTSTEGTSRFGPRRYGASEASGRPGDGRGLHDWFSRRAPCPTASWPPRGGPMSCEPGRQRPRGIVDPGAAPASRRSSGCGCRYGARSALIGERRLRAVATRTRRRAPPAPRSRRSEATMRRPRSARPGSPRTPACSWLR